MRLSPALTERKLLPGDWHVTDGPETLVTVLGSCVAVCMRDRVGGAIGINHFMLPGTRNERYHGVIGGSGAARFGAYAIDVMVNELVKRGALRQHLEAKVFGGASLLHAGNGVIGSRNGEFALEYLRAEEIRVVASDLGGDAPRKIYFSRERSTVGVRYLRRAGEDVARRERDYGSRLRAPAAGGELELFG